MERLWDIMKDLMNVHGKPCCTHKGGTFLCEHLALVGAKLHIQSNRFHSHFGHLSHHESWIIDVAYNTLV